MYADYTVLPSDSHKNARSGKNMGWKKLRKRKWRLMSTNAKQQDKNSLDKVNINIKGEQ